MLFVNCQNKIHKLISTFSNFYMNMKIIFRFSDIAETLYYFNILYQIKYIMSKYYHINHMYKLSIKSIQLYFENLFSP